MYDIIIIGSGPAGLTAAIYASRARLQTLVLERDTMGAGQIAVTEQVDNYPGLPHIGGYELGEKFREHATELGTLFCENDVTHLEKKDGYFTATLEDHTELQARSVIYAAGTSYRRLEIAGGRLAGVDESLFFFNPYSDSCPTYFPSKVGVIHNRVGNHCFYIPTERYADT